MNGMLKATSLIIAGTMLITIVIFETMSIQEIIVQIIIATAFLTIYVYCEHKEPGLVKNEA